MKGIITENYISAISRLFNFSSNRRQMIKSKQPDLTDIIGKIAVEINSEIIKRISVNIFEEYDLRNILEYENELNTLFTKYTDNNIIEGIELEDEINILKSYINTENDFFVKNNYSIKKGSIPKTKLKSLVISPIMLNKAIRPDYIHLIKDEIFNDNYFTTSVYQNKLILFHLSHDNKQHNVLNIQTALAFNLSRFKNMITNPTRIFLNIIDEYGVDIELNGKTRRFFKSVKVYNENVKGDLKFIKVKNVNKDDFSVHTNFIKTEFGARVGYAYGINTTQYEVDNLK